MDGIRWRYELKPGIGEESTHRASAENRIRIGCGIPRSHITRMGIQDFIGSVAARNEECAVITRCVFIGHRRGTHTLESII